MKVERVEKIDIDVKDIDKAANFFSDLLGIKFESLKYENVNYSHTLTEHADKAAEETPHKTVISPYPVGIDLLQEIPPREKEGLRALDLKVTDLEEAKAEMKRKGVRMISEWIVGNFKEAIFHPDDLHGVRLCLIEYKGDNLISAMKGK